jgi:hypothetical protein
MSGRDNGPMIDSLRLPGCAMVVGSALLAGCTPPLDWREFRPDGGAGLVMLLPCRPASHARMLTLGWASVRTTLHACTASGVTWGIVAADVQDPARVSAALTDLKASAAANLAVMAPVPVAGAVRGATPNPQAGWFALEGRYPDGRAARMQLAVFAHGTTVIQASALGERLDSEAVDNYFASLRIAP